MNTRKPIAKKENTKKQNPKIHHKKFYQDYLDGKLRLKKYQWAGTLMLIVVLTGVVGWVREFALAEIEGGFKHLYIKGGNLLPWMNIYAYGALAIIAVSWKLRRHPLAVFITSALVCGLLEWFAGWIVYTVGNGTRYWDYTHSWWGFGNINGFVCPMSAIIFGLGALALIYWLLPCVIKWSITMSKRAFLTLSITLFTIIITDDITNLTLKNLGLPTAHDFYRALGWVYKS